MSDLKKERALYDAILDSCDRYIGAPCDHEEEIVRVARVVTVLAHTLGSHVIFRAVFGVSRGFGLSRREFDHRSVDVRERGQTGSTTARDDALRANAMTTVEDNIEMFAQLGLKVSKAEARALHDRVEKAVRESDREPTIEDVKGWLEDMRARHRQKHIDQHKKQYGHPPPQIEWNGKKTKRKN